jgi:hypothetical protein
MCHILVSIYEITSEESSDAKAAEDLNKPGIIAPVADELSATTNDAPAIHGSSPAGEASAFNKPSAFTVDASAGYALCVTDGGTSAVTFNIIFDVASTINRPNSMIDDNPAVGGSTATTDNEPAVDGPEALSLADNSVPGNSQRASGYSPSQPTEGTD